MRSRTTGRQRIGRRAVSLLLFVAALSPFRLAGQVAVSAALGVRFTSPLVHDSIFLAPFDVQPALAPALQGIVGIPLDGPWQFEGVLDFSTSMLQRHETTGDAVDIVRLGVLGIGIGVRRTLQSWLRGRIAVGGLIYLPADQAGLFREGSGGLNPYGQVAVNAAPRAAARYGLSLELLGDVHRFITPALRSDGFTDPRLVYRVALLARFDIAGRQ